MSTIGQIKRTPKAAKLPGMEDSGRTELWCLAIFVFKDYKL